MPNGEVSLSLPSTHYTLSQAPAGNTPVLLVWSPRSHPLDVVISSSILPFPLGCAPSCQGAPPETHALVHSLAVLRRALCGSPAPSEVWCPPPWQVLAKTEQLAAAPTRQPPPTPALDPAWAPLPGRRRWARPSKGQLINMCQPCSKRFTSSTLVLVTIPKRRYCYR